MDLIKKSVYITCRSLRQPFAELCMSGKKTFVPLVQKDLPDRLYIYSPRRICKNECIRLGMDCKNLVTGAIIGYAQMDNSVFTDNDSRKIVLKNPKRLRVPIPCKGRPGFFRIKMPMPVHSAKHLESEIIDEEFRYRWIGHH